MLEGKRVVIEQDTIAAIATALGESSVGIVRVSGSEAGDIIKKVFRTPGGRVLSTLSEKGIHYGYVAQPRGEQLVDECMLLWMPGPRSYTAEDVAEFQVHGGVQTVQAALSAVLAAGCRLAEPGEFTKRAFLNGRVDLSQAEAVIDLIRAKTDVASRAALGQVKGSLGEKIRELRKRLLSLQAHVEVTIDYPEHDVESVACAQVVEVGGFIAREISALIDNAHVGQILREGVYTAIIGRPNVGKSSLLNALLRRDRAIVTDIPGTTRDVLEEYANIRGIPFRLVDTAGIRETMDVVEKIGVERSRQAVEVAELILLVLNGHEALTPDDITLLERTRELPKIVIVNKADLPQVIDEDAIRGLAGETVIVRMSARSQNGMAQLEERMEKMVVGGHFSGVEAAYMTNARQAKLLADALVDVQAAIDAASQGATLDIIAVQLQSVYASLGAVIGEEVGEELLDEIFSNFCLGK